MGFSGVLAVWAAINWNAVGSVIAGLALLSAVKSADRARRQQQAAFLVKTKVVLILANEAASILRRSQFRFGLNAPEFLDAELHRLRSQLDRIDEAGLPNDGVLTAYLDVRRILGGVDHPFAAETLRQAGIEKAWMNSGATAQVERLVETLKQHCRDLGANERDPMMSGPGKQPKVGDDDLLADFVPALLDYVATPLESGPGRRDSLEDRVGTMALHLVVAALASITMKRRRELGVEEDISFVARSLNDFSNWQGDPHRTSSTAFSPENLDALRAAFGRIVPLAARDGV